MKWLTILLLFPLCATAAEISPPSPDPRYTLADLQYSDDFPNLNNWSPELEKDGSLTTHDGSMDINVPAGCTVWFKPLLHGPLMIEYQATVISAAGPNDRVSDLNCFWMARDSRSPDDFLAHPRTGQFSDYDPLFTYYVGLGGNTNTTTRFRRYIGQQDNRPLLPQNDLRNKENLLTPNQPQTLRLIADGPLIQFWRNHKKLFELMDAHPYESGWFALRTTKNHLMIKHLRIWTVYPTPTTRPADRP